MIVAEDAVARGSIDSTGEVIINGRFDGDVRAKTIRVGLTGVLRGEAIAEKITITGEVFGRIGGAFIHLHAAAKVEGEITYHKISIEPGARCEGRTRQLIELVPDLPSAPWNKPRPALASPTDAAQMDDLDDNADEISMDGFMQVVTARAQNAAAPFIDALILQTPEAKKPPAAKSSETAKTPKSAPQKSAAPASAAASA